MPLEYIALPIMGLDDREPTMLEGDLAGRSPNLLNVRSTRDRIERAPGGTLFTAEPTLASGYGFRVGQFQKNAVTGNQVITHNLGATPVALLLWSSGTGTNGVATGNQLSFGATDGTRARCTARAADNAVDGVSGPASANTARARTNTLLLRINGDGTTEDECAFVSWTSTTFTINWTTSASWGGVINWAIFGGGSITAEVRSWNTAAAPGVQNVTSFGFEPKLCLHFHAGPGTTTPTATTHALLGMGAMDATSQWAWSTFSLDASTPTNSGRVQRAGLGAVGGSAILGINHLGVEDMDGVQNGMLANGFSIDWITLSAARAIWTLALGGADLSVKVQTFNAATGTAPRSQSVTGVGFEPGLLFLTGVETAQLGDPPTDTERTLVGVAQDNVTQNSTATRDLDDRRTSNTNRYSTQTRIIHDVGSYKQAALSSMDSDGFTLDWQATGQSPPEVDDAQLVLYAAAAFTGITAAGQPRNLAQGYFTGTTERLVMLTNTKAFIYNAGTGVMDDSGEAYSGVTAAQRYMVANSQDRMVWSAVGLQAGGTHQVRSYDGTAFSNLVANSTGGTKYSANIVLAFNDRIIIGDISEAGTRHPHRVRWPAATDVTDFRPTTDGAGLLEVIETSNAPLTGGVVLGERCYLTKAREVIELIATGTLSPVFRQETKISGIGCIARTSIAVGEYFAFWLGPDDVYQWDGQTLKPVGAGIYHTLIPLIDYQNHDEVQGAVFTTESEYHLIVGQDDFIYDYRRERWFRDRLSDIAAIGVWRVGSAITTDIEASQAIYYADTSRAIWRSDPSVTTFRGADIDSYVETKDYLAQEVIITKNGIANRPSLNKQNTVWRIHFKTNPNAVMEVAISIDRGVTWTNVQDVTADGNGVGIASLEVAFSIIRFRFRRLGNDDFELHAVAGYEYDEAGIVLGVLA